MNVLNHCCGILLWVLLLTIAQCAADCMLENFKRMSFFDANFELSNLKQNFANGETVRVPCKVGYKGFFKLICTTTGWDRRGDRCKPATCGHPGDVQFADFRLVSGKDYEFGSQVLYTCHKGYQMTSRTNTLNCLEKGWDGHLPECEPIPCPSITVKDGVLVNGDIDQPTSGRVIQFRCRDRGDALVGQAQIFCDENGVWSDEPPYCQEISCPKPPLDNFQIEGEKTVYKQKESLRYECNKGYIKVDGRPSVCQKSGLSAQWIPAPQCEPITCKLSSNPPAGTDYDNQGRNRFRPGESVWVVCGEKQWVKNTELQTAEVTCDETGQWDFDPVCQMVKCYKNKAENVYRMGIDYGKNSIDIDKSVWYSCYSQYRETSERATCTRKGWDPNPLCEEKKCTTEPPHSNAELYDSSYKKNEYNHGETVCLRCTYGPEGYFYRQCDYGKWIPQSRTPICNKKPCTTKPNITNGGIIDDDTRRTTYASGESLYFRCDGESNIFKVTCASGEWKRGKSCENVPCTAQPEIKHAQMDIQEEPPYPHGKSVSLTCTTGPKETFPVSCQSGKWITDHQCQEPSFCGDNEILHGLSHEYNKKLYYACSPGYKLLNKGWWDEAPCVNGTWNTSECVADTFCGKVPNIPNMNVTYKREKFKNGHKITIHCEPGFQNLHSPTELTCTKGNWSLNVNLTDVCTLIARKCDPPSELLNGLVLAPFEKTYVSGTVLTYKCRTNYTMEGNDTVQCNNGTWNRESIRCVAPTKTQLPVKPTEAGA